MPMSKSYEDLVDSLLHDTNASRTTVRLCRDDGNAELVAEALSPGIASMFGGPITNLSEAPTYQYLLKHHQLLIQNDCRNEGPTPPETLIKVYRVFAQMLAPVVVGGAMVATVSVHQVGSTRQWTSADIAALARAREQLEQALAGLSAHG